MDRILSREVLKLSTMPLNQLLRCRPLNTVELKQMEGKVFTTLLLSQ